MSTPRRVIEPLYFSLPPLAGLKVQIMLFFEPRMRPTPPSTTQFNEPTRTPDLARVGAAPAVAAAISARAASPVFQAFMGISFGRLKKNGLNPRIPKIGRRTAQFPPNSSKSLR